jgi:hypothetical protein
MSYLLFAYGVMYGVKVFVSCSIWYVKEKRNGVRPVVNQGDFSCGFHAFWAKKALKKGFSDLLTKSL